MIATIPAHEGAAPDQARACHRRYHAGLTGSTKPAPSRLLMPGLWGGVLAWEVSSNSPKPAPCPRREEEAPPSIRNGAAAPSVCFSESAA